MKHVLATAFVAASLLAAPAANAAVVVTSTPATTPYSGPAPTYNFETAAPVTGGSVVSTDVAGQHVRPTGSTGNYFAVGPADGSPGVLNLSSFGAISSLSFLWGSIDAYNVFELLDAANNVIFSINGSAVPGGNTNGNVSRVVNFAFTDLATQNAVNSARFSSSQNAFEVDNVAVQAVPEPTTWLLMILGMLGIGFTMRRSNKENTSRIRFA